MTNRGIAATWAYHNGTKHSYRSVRSGTHFLDWANQPLPFKIYSTLEPRSLPRDLEPLPTPALSTLSGLNVRREGERVPDLRGLATLLYFSAGITKRRTYPGGEIVFRAAACTGALYSIELYLVCGDLPDLKAGVYHFFPADFALRELRVGDYRSALAQAAAAEPGVAHAPVTMISTGTYWRNAWKYQARTYRHFGWDNGTILANLLAVSAALELPAQLVCGFVDQEVNRLLDLDTPREVALSLAAVGYVREMPPAPPKIVPLGLKTGPLSRKEVDYPAMREMHAASSLPSAEEVAAWRGQTPPCRLPPPAGRLIPIQPLHATEIPQDPLDRVISRRGSTRQFTRQAISFAQLATILYRAMQGMVADFLDPPGLLLNDVYLIVHAVEGLAPGAYVLHRDAWALECLKEGNFRDEAGHLALDQELAADACVTVFFLADLQRILERFGNRGYRAVQLEAGILGGKLYLAAYALGLGATGLTFYDDEVPEFFAPHATGKSAIFLVALGRSARAAPWLVKVS